MNSIVLGSFFGDCGKGQCVNNLCLDSLNNGKKPLVVRFSGGHQVGHNVLHNGQHHCFSNFGSGTLLGVPTYWSEYCTVDPITTIAEAKVLNSIGISPKIVYSPFCQIVVPFDVWHQWNDEDNKKHGTVGTGFKACLDRVKAGYSLTLADAKNPIILREKLRAILNNYYYYRVDNLPMLNLDKWVIAVSEFVSKVPLRHFVQIKSRFDDFIYEGSQGILLDQRFGIMPYCTPSNTTCQNAMKFIGNEDVLHYYVCRPYITRHGNGPLCNLEPIIPVNDDNNQYNEFQQTMRASEFSVELLKHSVGIDSLFYNPHKWPNRILVFSHADEVSNDLFNKVNELSLFGDIYGFEFEQKVNLRR